MILTSNNELITLKQSLNNKIIVLCHGCFDIFHYGHLTYLKNSKQLGDSLVVSITSDKFINKGNNRPVFNINQRLEIINELKCVDYCCISNDYTCIDIIKQLKPNIYSKGNDVKGKEDNINENLYKEYQELKIINGKLIFVDIIPNISSTNILSKYE